MSTSARARRRRRWWPLLLAVAFIVVPLVEIYAVIRVGQVIGVWWTILILVADSLLGAWLVRREGARAWRALRDRFAGGGLPGRELADGALILIGGTLLLTPGFVTDVLGFLLVLPFTRPIFRRLLTSYAAGRVTTHVAASFPVQGFPVQGFPAQGFPAQGSRTQQRPGHDDVVRGEVLDDE